jgi:very-short-patch-repair endonuclease
VRQSTHEVMRRQAGVISRAQALACGLTERQIDHRLRTGRWSRLFAGVYVSSDAALTWRARAHAGQLACGPEAVVIGESAAALRALVPERSPVHVAIPTELRRRLGGPHLTVHRLEVAAAERVVVRGLVTTTRLRTAIDLAHLSPVATAQPVIDRMLVLDQIDLAELTDAVAASRRRGSAQARRLMRSAQDAAAADSERLARRLLVAAGIKGWVSNYQIRAGGRSRKVDLANVRLRIAVEVKGWVFHSLADRAASDDSRVVDLQLEGWIVIPVGWLVLTTEPETFLAQVRAAVELRARGSAA